jgi:squalene-hopene/tetraprenyl-beta-curcumene cyclase
MSEQEYPAAGRQDPVVEEEADSLHDEQAAQPPGTRLARRHLLQAALGLASAATASGGSAAVSRRASSGTKQTRAAVRHGAEYLAGAQAADGSWQHYPGITALAVMALASAEGRKHPGVRRGARFLASLAQPDGGIYDPRDPARALPNYNTALSLTALRMSEDPAHHSIIQRAQVYLSGSQFDERQGYTRSHPAYGGIGYGSQPDRPDLSNLQQALEALKETDFPANAPLWQKAVVFLQRCQNREKSNDQGWAEEQSDARGDGGFIYASNGESKAGGHRSYGSMTYAGLKSYLYCGVSRTDPRARAAWSWIRAHYTVGENPGMGEAGLYYHYHTMSKTLLVYGQRLLLAADGRRHPWAADLAAELARRQQRDGAWVNSNPRWLEDNRDLVTSYALLALSRCLQALET